MIASAMSLLEVCDKGWRNPIQVECALVRATWALSDVGVLSAMLPAQDAYKQGVAEWAGKWVRWRGSAVGTWAGIVVDTPVDLVRRTVELSCRGMAWRLSKRRVAPIYTPVMVPPGALAVRVITDAAHEFDHWFRRITAGEDGLPMQFQWRAIDSLSAIKQLASSGPAEWAAGADEDGTLWFSFAPKLGRDKTGSVLLVEGYQITSGQVMRSIDPMVNDLLGIADNRQYERSAQYAALDTDSIQMYDRLQGTRRYPGLGAAATIRPRAKADLARLSKVVIAPRLILSDREPLLAEIGLGDSFRVWLASANARYTMRAHIIVADVNTGTVEITGDAEAA